MRYYDIKVFNSDGSVFAAWSSLGNDGNPDPGALNINFDIQQQSTAGTTGAGYVQIWGVGILTVAQQSLFYKKNISIKIGMSKGLPLANPAQQGVPIEGTIYNSFGNWQGTNQTLSLFFNPTGGSFNAPLNFVLNWKAGTPLTNAIKSAIQTAIPNVPLVVRISDRLVTNSDQPGFYKTFEQFGKAVLTLSKAIIKDTGYLGVQCVYRNGGIFVYDSIYDASAVNATDTVGATKENPKIIVFNDLVGQPTWTNTTNIQLQVIARGDIYPGEWVSLPFTVQTSTEGSFNPLRNKLTFSGVYIVTQVRHVGNFRQPTGTSWITIIETSGDIVAPTS